MNVKYVWYCQHLRLSSCYPGSGITYRVTFELPHGPLTRYVKLCVVHTLRMPGMFSPPPRVSDPDMHHGTCVTHVPWLLTSGFLGSRWRGKRSRHSRRMRRPAFLHIWYEAWWSQCPKRKTDCLVDTTWYHVLWTNQLTLSNGFPMVVWGTIQTWPKKYLQRFPYILYVVFRWFRQW